MAVAPMGLIIGCGSYRTQGFRASHFTPAYALVAPNGALNGFTAYALVAPNGALNGFAAYALVAPNGALTGFTAYG